MMYSTMTTTTRACLTAARRAGGMSRRNSQLSLFSSTNGSGTGRPPMPRVRPENSGSGSSSSSSSNANAPTSTKVNVTPSSAGSGRGPGGGGTESSMAQAYARTANRTPVTWTSLFIATITAAAAVAYYRIERERRLEEHLGRIVSSESNVSEEGSAREAGWTPKPNYLAKRKFVQTPTGQWIPVEDGWGAPGKPAIGGPWSLVDLEGNLVTNESFKGKWLLLYFGFARCPDICPSEMQKVATVLDTLKQSHPALYKKIVPIFVSVDPARDSLQALRAYAKDFHPDYIFLTGAPTQVDAMCKKYRVYRSKADETAEGDYLVDHSIVIYLHDDTGDLADCLTQSMRPVDVTQKVIERMTAAAATTTMAA